MDDSCTARLRLLRLFAYLRGHGYEDLYLAARQIMPAIFHAENLAKKVKEGKWGEATIYINRFAPFSKSGYKARLLMQFLIDFNALDAFARKGSSSGSYFWKWLGRMYKSPVLDKYPCFATLVEDVVSKNNGHARTFLNWQLVRNKAAEVAEEMAYKTPELRGRMQYPRGRSDLYHIVPVGSRRCIKKNSGRKQSAALAHYYLQMKKRLPSSSQGINHNDESAEMLYGESLQKMLHGEPLIALFETSLEAGRCSIVKDGLPPQLSKDGVPFVWTKAARTFKVTVTPRTSLQRRPELSLGLALKRALLQDSRREIAHPGASRVTLPSSLQRQPELSSGLAMKRATLQESSRDIAHPGKPSKKPRTTGNDPSPSFEAPHHSLIRNEGTSKSRRDLSLERFSRN